ncbi:unnamed protein product [Vitrella brassicaformis CCMP3155]|uniref:Potassium channel tetramerisation-type BTB domain-containing protein n=1 Tax=Vitrella brassicaformis (strain CCMP3155) TaxID=1169540 RepID=A0A0G4EQR5_VITBC|nr:unnamed protein product [Vitrella brassicaformis CCMP3155]|eukprot:CEM00568.1 unnamed protein product [Vitrella brassicaformis CCMP3155]
MKTSSSIGRDTADASSKLGSKPADKNLSDRPLLLNVGGTLMAFPCDVLRGDGLEETCLAVLLNRFDSWMIRDADGIHFIDADPFYFTWLAVKLRYLHYNRIAVTDITDGCPSLAFYHDRFMAHTDLSIDAQPGDENSEAFRDFMAVMGPFIDTSAGGTGGREVLSVTVDDGRVVATTDATLADYNILYDRFTKYRGPVVDVSATNLHKVVDYVRRIRLAPDGVTPLPMSTSPGELLYACEMYGLMERVYLSMIGKPHSHIKCIFKGSRDGGELETLLDRVTGAQGGLLFVIEDEEQHRFACHLEGSLIPPTGPTAVLTTGCPVTFYSISGPFNEEGITKITVPHHQQRVVVAGKEATVKTDDTVVIGGVVIGGWSSVPVHHGKVVIGGGRLWLGHRAGAPPPNPRRRGPTAGDLHSCRQWLTRGDLPSGKTYVGSFHQGRATLAGSHVFTAHRLEVYQVWSIRPADPIIPADELQALVDMAANTPMAAQLLFKGLRDGWTYEALFAKVGEAANLLLVIKDTGSHTFASHVEGQLKQPADPTSTLTTGCPVAFYSISGAIVAYSGVYRGKVAIGGGRLWVGAERGGAAGDLRRCCQCLLIRDLPDGRRYRGDFTTLPGYPAEMPVATLAASPWFTCVDLEVYRLEEVPYSWLWLSAAASLMESRQRGMAAL